MELVIKSEKGNPVTTSLKVSEIFSKEHKHVLEAIRNLVAEKTAAKYFYETEYENRGKKYPMYLMNRDGFSLLVMGFTGTEALKFKIDFIEAFNKMENIIKSNITTKLPDFSNPVLAARAWADEVEAKQLAQSQVKELQPKAEIADRINSGQNNIAMNDVAKIIGIGRNTLMAQLRDNMILRKNNTPYQQYIDSEYFVVKVTPIKKGESGFNVTQTYVTAKGLLWLTEKIKLLTN